MPVLANDADADDAADSCAAPTVDVVHAAYVVNAADVDQNG